MVELPPEALIQDCPRPQIARPKTNRDLLDAIRAWEDALRLCNVDKKALREWRDAAEQALQDQP